MDIQNISNGLWSSFPPELISKFEGLIGIVKAIGIVILIYIILLIIQGVSSILRNRRIKKIYERVESIENKLDALIKKKVFKKR